jgi:hypothetical protein
MTQQEFREEMLAYRTDAERAADERRDTWIVLDRLDRLYSSFDEAERAQANVVLAEWILSPVQSFRYDARHLARKFRIGSLLDALWDSAARLSASAVVGDPEEAVTVRSLIQFLQPENVVVLQPARGYAASENAAERVS